MAKGKSDKPTFKEYNQKQIELIPRIADELIPEKHLVRVVNETIDGKKLDPLLKQSTIGEGASRYSPLMMLKVFVSTLMQQESSQVGTKNRFVLSYSIHSNPRDTRTPSGLSREIQGMSIAARRVISVR